MFKDITLIGDDDQLIMSYTDGENIHFPFAALLSFKNIESASSNTEMRIRPLEF